MFSTSTTDRNLHERNQIYQSTYTRVYAHILVVHTYIHMLYSIYVQKANNSIITELVIIKNLYYSFCNVFCVEFLNMMTTIGKDNLLRLLHS